MTIKRTNKKEEQVQPERRAGDLYPSLRTGIEPFPARMRDGKLFIGLRDHLNLSREQLVLPQDLLYVLQFMDGRHSGLDIRAEYMRKFGTFLFENMFLELIDRLDRLYLLDNQRSKDRILELTEEFKKQPVRQPTNAGISFPEKPEELVAEFDSYIESEKTQPRRYDRITAVVVPHIEIRMASSIYARVYSTIAGNETADLYVILGIGHQGISHHFSMTEKSFATPLGLVHTEKSLVRQIGKDCRFDVLAEELVHKLEHSIEFQTIFLRHFVKREFKILPVLCSFGYTDFNGPDGAEIQSFISLLKSCLASYDGSICIVASVDFAHVGPRYGDSSAPDAFFMAKVEQNDREILHALADGDQNRFQDTFKRNDDRFRVCGYSALTTLLELLPQNRAELLDYGTAVMDNQKSTVTFAGMVFSAG